MRKMLFIVAGVIGPLAALAAGCTDIGGLTIDSDDQIAQPGQTVRVVVRIERTGLSRFFPMTNPPPVRIYRDNDLLVEAVPRAGVGEVAAEVTLDVPGEHAIDAIYQRRPDHKPDQATCHAYCWDASKVAVVVDFDRVINRVGRFDRYMADLPLGQVADEAADVLTALSRQFYICYVTELDNDLKPRIRTWLRDNGLPTGPIFHWRRPRPYRMDPGDQAAVLARLRQRVPTLLIGIGDGSDDLAAFRKNNMLGVMVELAGPTRGPLDTPRCDNWRGLWQFFSLPANQPILSDPRQMLDLHYRGGQYVGGDRADDDAEPQANP